jgi:hypothetical protein
VSALFYQVAFENFAFWAQGLLHYLRNHEYVVRPMLFLFIGTTVILGMSTRFADLNKGGFFGTFRGQIVHGALSIACLVLVAVAFWLFGWKIGLLDFFLVIIAANVGLTL